MTTMTALPAVPTVPAVPDVAAAERVEPTNHRSGIDGQEIHRRLRYVGFEAADLARIRAVAPSIAQAADALTDVFFEALGRLSDARRLFDDPHRLHTVRQLKRAHLIDMLGGSYDRAYVEDRLELGQIYFEAGIEPSVFIGAYQRFLAAVGRCLMEQDVGPMEAFENFLSFRKVAFFDLSLIVDILVLQREQVIQRQQRAIRELSIPILRIRDHLLMLPLVGIIDLPRAAWLAEKLLEAVRTHRAKVVVLNVTGVPVIDAGVANSLLRSISAAALLGARTIVTGMSDEVCQTLVGLGLDLSKLNAVGDLERGIEEGYRMLGLRR
jgi:rsbT co-antagonist protein RsbR